MSRCDGDHADPPCADPECWIGGITRVDLDGGLVCVEIDAIGSSIGAILRTIPCAVIKSIVHRRIRGNTSVHMVYQPMHAERWCDGCRPIGGGA